MAIAYPLEFPACRYSGSYKFGLTPTVAVSASPFSGEQQTYEWPSAPWQAAFEVLLRTPADRGAMMGFVAALRGRRGTVLLGSRHASRPRGTASTTGVQVATGGATARARLLPLSGLGIMKTLLPGDMVQLSGGAAARLHCVTELAISDGAGQATVSIDPPLRTNYPAGTQVTLVNPRTVFRSTTNEVVTYMQMGGLLTASFAFAEAL